MLVALLFPVMIMVFAVGMSRVEAAILSPIEDSARDRLTERVPLSQAVTVTVRPLRARRPVPTPCPARAGAGPVESRPVSLSLIDAQDTRRTGVLSLHADV